MKRLISGLVILGSGVISALAQTGSPSMDANVATTDATPYTLVERGQHYKIWERIDYEVTPDGQRWPHPHRFTELATGLSYMSNGQWVDSQEIIESVPGGAIAQQGNHKVRFANNLADSGAITLQTPDGKQLLTTIIGLSYFDTATGASTLIAEVKDCQGKIVAPNQVLYSDAFNDVNCSVRYTYTKAGFEQDILVNAQLPDPAEFGLNPQTTVLQVLTEFFTPPQPGKRIGHIRFHSGAVLEDDDLDFGAMKFVRGKAFSAGQQGEGNDIPVARQWMKLDNRDVLVEQVSLPDLQAQLNALPKAEGASVKSVPGSVRRTASLQRVLPARRGAQNPASSQNMQMQQAALNGQSPKSSAKAMEIAAVTRQNPCVVIDYTTLSTSFTNYVFTSDNWGTYYISGTVNLCGTNIWEGHCILKYAAGASINLLSTVGVPKAEFRSVAYKPAVFTSMNDNSLGENITGSSGNPNGSYSANPALSFSSAGTQTIGYARFAYAKQAISAPGTVLNLSHCQFVGCQSGLNLNNSTNYIRNALFANTLTNFQFQAASACQVENGTFSSSRYLATATTSGSTLTLTNCILANVTNLASGSIQPDGLFNGLYNSSAFGSSTFTNTAYPFQSVGAGSYYLTNDVFRNVVTTNITPSLLVDLAKTTTYPPLVYSNATITTPTNLAPQATRDSDTPDLGWHYAPLDYCIGGCNLNTNLSFSSGTAVGWFQTSQANWAFNVANYITLNFDGRAESPCYWTQVLTVQDGANGQGSMRDEPGSIIGSGDSQYGNNIAPSPQVRARFTRFSSFAGHGNHFRDNYAYLIVRLTDSEIWSGGAGGYGTSYYLTNCLLDRVGCSINQGWPGNEMCFQNCTFRAGTLGLSPSSTTIPARVHYCAFDGTSISFGNVTPDISYNSFLYTSNRFNGYTTGDVIVTNTFNWQSNWLGRYYLPSDSTLIDKGTTNTAAQLGLYHYTTQTNQTKEANSLIDIGYHYVAVDGNGNPIDTDGDGIPDYWEDRNGNGLVDAGESDWFLNAFNGLSTVNGLQVFTPLK